jgi:hypothetical protein
MAMTVLGVKKRRRSLLEVPPIRGDAAAAK